jgi:hypothetical protein
MGPDQPSSQKIGKKKIKKAKTPIEENETAPYAHPDR